MVGTTNIFVFLLICNLCVGGSFETAYIQLRAYHSRWMPKNGSLLDWEQLQFKNNIDFDALMVATWIKYTGIYQFSLEYTCNYTDTGTPRTTDVAVFEYYNNSNCIGTSVQYYSDGKQRQSSFQFSFLVQITVPNDQYFVVVNDTSGCTIPESTDPLRFPSISLSITGIDLDINHNVSVND